MSRFTRSFAAALVVLAFAVPSLAAQAKPNAQPKVKSQSIVGTLQRVDGANLTIQTSKGAETVMLAPAAEIRMGTKSMTVADLGSHSGDRVRVKVSESNGQKTAQAVTLMAAKPTQTASAATTPKPAKASKK